MTEFHVRSLAGLSWSCRVVVVDVRAMDGSSTAQTAGCYAPAALATDLHLVFNEALGTAAMTRSEPASSARQVHVDRRRARHRTYFAVVTLVVYRPCLVPKSENISVL